MPIYISRFCVCSYSINKRFSLQELTQRLYKLPCSVASFEFCFYSYKYRRWLVERTSCILKCKCAIYLRFLHREYRSAAVHDCTCIIMSQTITKRQCLISQDYPKGRGLYLKRNPIGRGLETNRSQKRTENKEENQ